MKSIPTQEQFDQPWYKRWADELKIEIKPGTPKWYFRKGWEWAWMLANMERIGFLKPGMKGLGFGVGLDRVAPLLVKYGHDIVLTDIEPTTDCLKEWWVRTDQHCSGNMQMINRDNIVSDEEFYKHARFEYLDMNGDFSHMKDFDYCWSLNSMDHLGSIEAVRKFLIKSMDVLKVFGLSIHTTELNITPADGKPGTYTEESTVFLKPKHLLQITSDLEKTSHFISEFDIKPGTGEYDNKPATQPYDGAQIVLNNNDWWITSVGIYALK